MNWEVRSSLFSPNILQRITFQKKSSFYAPKNLFGAVTKLIISLVISCIFFPGIIYQHPDAVLILSTLIDSNCYAIFFLLAECHFGKELKELGSTWFPDLGAPFGKMYCIKCECVPVSIRRNALAIFPVVALSRFHHLATFMGAESCWRQIFAHLGTLNWIRRYSSANTFWCLFSILK